MKKMNNKGFSLIELIIVIAIMAVLVAVIAPNLTGYIGKSKANTDKSNADTIENTLQNALQDFTTDNEMPYKAAKVDGTAATDTADSSALKNYTTVNALIQAAAGAGEGSFLDNVVDSLSKYITGTGASAVINTKVTANEFKLTITGDYDNGFTCTVKTGKKSAADAD